MAAADRMERGEHPLEAERNARREFGNELLVRETTRDMWTWTAWENAAQDLKYAVRRMRTHKGFTLITILTLALGIGVNTAIFTLVHAVMFNTLPVRRPAELYRLGRGDNCCVMTGYQNGQDFSLFSYELYQTLREGTPSLQDLAAFQAKPQIVNVRRGGGAESGMAFKAEYVSSNYFALFSLRPALGSFFRAGDEVRGTAPTLVLSYRAWQMHFGGEPGVIGSSLIVKGKVFTVVGVAPRGFYGETLRSDPPDCWLPAVTEPLLEGTNSLYDLPAKMWLYLMGRVPPSVSTGRLESQINGETKRWYFEQAGAEASPKARRDIEDQFVPLTPAAGGVETMGLAYHSGLMLLLSLSSLVLLIACANVANLLLARGTALRGQNSLKVALGASRARRMIRQVLIDSLLLSLLGGAAGLALAFSATRLIVMLAFRGARYVPISTTPSLPVLAFAFALSVLTGLLFGIAPAWMETRTDPAEALRGASRSTPSAALLPQKFLVIVQAMLSFVLLTGAGLLTESLRNLEGQNFGFRTEQRLIVRVNPDMKDYTRGTAYRNLSRAAGQALPRARRNQCRARQCTPADDRNDNWNTFVWAEGYGAAPLQGTVSFDHVSPGYFDAIGTPPATGPFVRAIRSGIV